MVRLIDGPPSETRAAVSDTKDALDAFPDAPLNVFVSLATFMQGIWLAFDLLTPLSQADAQEEDTVRRVLAKRQGQLVRAEALRRAGGKVHLLRCVLKKSGRLISFLFTKLQSIGKGLLHLARHPCLFLSRWRKDRVSVEAVKPSTEPSSIVAFLMPLNRLIEDEDLEPREPAGADRGQVGDILRQATSAAIGQLEVLAETSKQQLRQEIFRIDEVVFAVRSLTLFCAYAASLR
ncbi:unnamed protein product, partial [Mesorhabditis spiculigera]